MYTVTEFTPYSALAGGMMIGLAAVLLLALNGRIAGVSGIVGRLLESDGDERRWRLAFTLGLIAGAFAFLQVYPGAVTVHLDNSLPVLMLAGLIVGIGTRMGGGCTSGHGVCGIGRGAPRSVVATVVFMGVAVLTVFVLRHGLEA